MRNVTTLIWVNRKRFDIVETIVELLIEVHTNIRWPALCSLHQTPVLRVTITCLSIVTSCVQLLRHGTQNAKKPERAECKLGSILTGMHATYF